MRFNSNPFVGGYRGGEEPLRLSLDEQLRQYVYLDNFAFGHVATALDPKALARIFVMIAKVWLFHFFARLK